MTTKYLYTSVSEEPRNEDAEGRREEGEREESANMAKHVLYAYPILTLHFPSYLVTPPEEFTLGSSEKIWGHVFQN